jgi:hypothetical protein
MRLALSCDNDQPEEIPPSGESTSGKTGYSCHLAVGFVTKRKLPDMANESGISCILHLADDMFIACLQ